MSVTTMPVSALASEDWELAEDDRAKPWSLVVQLRKRAHIFPWLRLVYAEGDPTQVKIAFGSHLVTVRGHGLDALLADVATQRVVRLIQPTGHEGQFGIRGASQTKYAGRSIDDITVEELS
jgi:hypothetical protein